MQSVTNNTDVWLPKQAVPYEYGILCKDKKCQSTGVILNMIRTVNLCKNLNLKELCYCHHYFHMWTAMKTSVMQSGELIANGLFTA